MPSRESWLPMLCIPISNTPKTCSPELRTISCGSIQIVLYGEHRPGLAASLAGLPGIAQISDMGRHQDLRLEEGQDAQEMLRALLERTRVERFELTRPSLRDIFLRLAGPAAAEVHAPEEALAR